MTVESPALPEHRFRAERWGPVVALVVGSCLAWLRLPMNTGDSIWGEDGIVFVRDWVSHGSPRLLFEPYAGYQHFIPRVLSGLVVAFLPVSAYGWWITVLSCVLVGATAAFTYQLSRSVIVSQWARTGLAGIPVLLPLAGQEPIGNLANFHWYAMYLMPWVLLAEPRSNRTGVATAALAFALAATEPQTLIFLPLALIRAWPLTRARVVGCGFVLGLAAQTLTYLVTDRPRLPGSPPVMSTLEGYLANVSLSVFTGDSPGTGAVIEGVGWWIGYLSLALFVGAGVLAYSLGTSIVRLTVLVLVVSSAASWVASFVLNNWPPAYYSEMTAEQLAEIPLYRWGTSAGMLLAAVVPVLAGVLAGRGGKPAKLAPMLVVALLGVMALTFHNTDSVRGKNVPTWTQEVERADRICASAPTGEVNLQTSPATWNVSLPCSLFLD